MTNKEKYGEVNTDIDLIKRMLSILPQKCYENPNLKWLDPCCGKGYFMVFLFNKLFQSLKHKIPDDKKRKAHIL